MRAAVLTVSDSVCAGTREDCSGPRRSSAPGGSGMGRHVRRQYRMRSTGSLTNSSNGWMMVMLMPCLRREEPAWQRGT